VANPAPTVKPATLSSTDKVDALIERLSVPKVTNNKRSYMLSGRAGVGKTHAALETPGSILCVYTDRNRDTLLAMQDRRDDITELAINDWDKDWKPLQVAIDNRQLPFDNIVIDSMDELLTIGLEDIKRKAGGKLEFEQWEEVRVMSKKTTFTLTQAPRPHLDLRAYNVIVTMHIQAQEGKNSELIKYQPAILGGFRDKIEQYFDFIFLADSETKMVKDPATQKSERQKFYFLRTVEPSAYYTCKARSGWPARVESFNEILELIDSASSGPASQTKQED